MLAETMAPVKRLQAALDLAARALFGTPTAPILTLCDERECTTHAAACLAVAADEEVGRYTVPAQCRICGGWFVIPDPEVTR